MSATIHWLLPKVSREKVTMVIRKPRPLSKGAIAAVSILYPFKL